jgi:hypothetical protein
MIGAPKLARLPSEIVNFGKVLGVAVDRGFPQPRLNNAIRQPPPQPDDQQRRSCREEVIVQCVYRNIRV